MQQVKIFKSIESNVAALEGEVNAWIRQSGARVIAVTGNIAPQSAMPGGAPAASMGQGRFPPSDVVLIVLYEAPGS